MNSGLAAARRPGMTSRVSDYGFRRDGGSLVREVNGDTANIASVPYLYHINPDGAVRWTVPSGFVKHKNCVYHSNARLTRPPQPPHLRVSSRVEGVAQAIAEQVQ